MAKGPENIFRDNVVRPTLDNIPCYYFLKEAASLRGLPDIIGVTKGGRFFAFEVKKGESELGCKRTALQAYILKKIRNMGGFAEFLYPENFQRTIKTFVFSSFPDDEANTVWNWLAECCPHIQQSKDSIPEEQ